MMAKFYGHVYALEWVVLVCSILLCCLASGRTMGVSAIAREDGYPGTSVGWNPKDDHPCTIEKISMKNFLKKYGNEGGLPPLYPRPLVITSSAIGRDGDNGNNMRNSKFRDLMKSNTILDSFPVNFTVTLSSSNSFSEHRRTVPFQTYLKEVITGPALDAETKSNETWYLFGETYSQEWKDVLKDYQVPPCQACKDDSLVALSFGIGNSGSGVQWHVHGPGFSETIHGRKHWILYPFENQPDFHPDQTSLNWMHYNYAAFERLDERPLECTLYPGDMIYL